MYQQIHNVSPELQALCILARTSVASSTHTQLVDLLSRPTFNWEQFWRLTKHHRVQPLVATTLQTIAPGCVRSQDRPVLHQVAQANAHRNLILTGSLVSLVQAFESQAIPLIAYKGSILALTVYGNVSLRRFADLDIWVNQSDAVEAAEILTKQGFEVDRQLSWETNWVNRLNGVQVDLHHSLTPSFFPLTLPFDDVYARSQTIRVVGTMIHTLCAEDNLLMLCVNLARDYWEKGATLLQLCDVAELLRTTNDLNQHVILQRSTQTGCRRIILVGIALAHQLLEAPLGEILKTAIQCDRQVEPLTEQITQQLLSLDLQAEQTDSKLRFYWQIRERKREKIAYLLTPNEQDRQFLTWKPPFSGMYYLIRPLRLAVQWLRP